MTLLSIALLLGVGAVSVTAQSSLYGQCGGIGWTGPTTCVAGSVCTYSNPYYSQCLPGTGTTTTTTKTTTTKSSSTSTPSSTPTKTASLQFAGVNIAGFDFGCGTDGTCNITDTYPPLVQYTGIDGAGQMQHFVKDDGFNIFRLPVAWQFLIGNANTAGSTLNAANFAKYDALVQACLSAGAHCIIDIHNYARFNGAIVGQGGPADSVLAALWGNIAAKYATQANVVFGIMNEPHDIPNINTWATTVQASVTAIRKAGATSQIILLPGNDYTSAEEFVSNGSGPALLTVVNLDGTTKNLIFDVHKYLDSDNSGTHADCVTNNIDSSWAPLATWLRQNGRQALNTETGGGNVADCVTYICQQIAYQAQNSDVFLGYLGWSAGAFGTTYTLSEVPTKNGNTWTDTSLVKSCMAPISGSQKGST